MHIEVTKHGEIVVVGSRRLRSRLHGQDMADRVAIVDRLVSTSLLTREQGERVAVMAQRVWPQTVDAWEAVVAAALTEDAEAVEVFLAAYEADRQEINTQLFDRAADGPSWMESEEEEHLHVQVSSLWT